MVKAQETQLETLLEGKKQYQVPLYQRVYAWDKKDRDRLWDDILELVETRRTDTAATHFIGSVVLSESPDNAAARMQRYLVVDGQQRLTTLSLLIAALRNHLVVNGEAAPASRMTSLSSVAQPRRHPVPTTEKFDTHHGRTETVASTLLS